MCGITGYVGKDEAAPILIKGLARLEYRGYDSAGIAVLEGHRIRALKMPGKIKELYKGLKKTRLNGTTGIAHTRWATHGIPNYINAHPHYDCRKAIALVHNGIIENCEELKAQLKKEGHKFLSETDTEVLPHLIEKYYKGVLEDAVRRALKDAKGSYAIAVIHKDEPGKLVGARCGSPLVVGIGTGENFLASDCPAIMDRDISQAEKGGYAHFMLKEIYDQPRVVHEILSSRADVAKGRIDLEGIKITTAGLREVDNIVISACGTAYHAGLVGEYLIEKFARIPVEVDVSSELRYRNTVYGKRSLFIAVSQSGETADTLAALREAKKNGVKTVSICNVVGSDRKSVV